MVSSGGSRQNLFIADVIFSLQRVLEYYPALNHSLRNVDLPSPSKISALFSPLRMTETRKLCVDVTKMWAYVFIFGLMYEIFSLKTLQKEIIPLFWI